MKKRSESFFGLHCDYHAQPSYGVQGQTLKEEDIRKICRVLRPDFIQIDSKGHPGWASYPSRIGNAMPSFAKNTLELWKRVTEEEGVALYTHYSGVYDVRYCKEHPDQNVINADGTPSHGTTRTDGSYVDEILIPQLCELAEEYRVNGAWVDGECWNTAADFRAESLKEFEKSLGIELNGIAPATPADPYYYEYREFFCEKFRAYMRHYVDTIHKKYPDFQITSNWAFSDYMPEPVSVEVDFLSGDLNPYDSLNSARYAARALAQQKKHWDLMSWNFRVSTNGIGACIVKHPTQIKQEAAAVISLGGGYQNYVTQFKDGAPRLNELCQLSSLAEFLREREPFCFQGRPIHQAGLLLSSFDRSREAEGALYSRKGYEKIMGMTALLCDVGQSLEIISEHNLSSAINDLKIIVVPELFHGIEKKTALLLLDYAKAGGNLVLIGSNTCSLFQTFGAPISIFRLPTHFDVGEMAYDNGGNESNTSPTLRPYCFTMDNIRFGSVFFPCSVNSDGCEILANVASDSNEEKLPFAIKTKFGKGNICAIGADLGSQYLTASQYLHRELIKKTVNDLYEPIVKIKEACGNLEVVVLEKNGNTLIQLLNTNGSHNNPNVSSDDFIPPVIDVKLSISLKKKPSRIILQPGEIELPFVYSDNKTCVGIDRIDIHNIIQIIL